jgi:hypothetical protein
MPHWVFGASVVFMVLTVFLALVTDRKPQPPKSPPQFDAFLSLIPAVDSIRGQPMMRANKTQHRDETP